MLGFFLDFIFPKQCVHCGKIGQYLCKNCQAKFEPSKYPICPMCERDAIDGITHPACVTRYSLDGLVSFYRYDGPVKAGIKRLKYKPYLPELAETVVHYSSNKVRSSRYARTINFSDFVVVPVPLHPQRQRERGFNQASLIGKAIAKQFGLPFADQVLKRTRNTKPQVALKGDDRRKNLADAFALTPNIVISQYPNILLVDDVWTTGSTLRNCGNVLKRAGAKKVWAMTIAR